jgi:serine/threonine protein phosphatase PrpC
VLQRSDGSVEVVGRGGTLLGFAPSPRLWEVAVDLHPRDRLILFTDGLSEAIEGDGEAAPVTVADLVAGTRDASLDDLADRLLEAAATGRRVDDVAICVLEVTPNRDRALHSV